MQPVKNDKKKEVVGDAPVIVQPVQPIMPKQQVPGFKYQQQLEQLRAMGFNDDEKMKKELIEQKGNVQRVANRLLHI